jgi:hypothetical protein
LGDTFSVHLLKSTQALDVLRRGRSPVLAGDVDFDGFDIVPSLSNLTPKTLDEKSGTLADSQKSGAEYEQNRPDEVFPA